MLEPKLNVGFAFANNPGEACVCVPMTDGIDKDVGVKEGRGAGVRVEVGIGAGASAGAVEEKLDIGGRAKLEREAGAEGGCETTALIDSATL